MIDAMTKNYNTPMYWLHVAKAKIILGMINKFLCTKCVMGSGSGLFLWG